MLTQERLRAMRSAPPDSPQSRAPRPASSPSKPPHRRERPPGERPSEERPTEDDIARAHLGGVKGSPRLQPAPLTRKEAEQMLPNDDPGQVA